MDGMRDSAEASVHMFEGKVVPNIGGTRGEGVMQDIGERWGMSGTGQCVWEWCQIGGVRMGPDVGL